MRGDLRLQQYLVYLVVNAFLLTCGGTSSSKLAEESSNPGATGEVVLQHSYSFTQNAWAGVPQFVFLYQNDGNPNPTQTAQSLSLRQQRIDLRALGGTINSGIKSAYTWSVTGLPDWMELDQDASTYFIRIKASAAINSPCTTSQPCEPSAATGQIRSLTITNGGAGYSPPATVNITSNDGIGFEVNSGAVLTSPGNINGLGELISLPVTNRGAGYTSVPTISISGGTTQATWEIELQEPIDLQITATADSGKSTTVNTKLIVLFNDKSPDGSGPLYPNMFKAYSISNGNRLSSLEDDRFPNDVDSTSPAADPDNDSCNLALGEYQPMIPGQTMTAHGGISGVDCYAFYVPADDIQVSFTVATGSSLNGFISKCSTPQPNSCDYRGGTSNTTYQANLTTWQNNVQNNIVDGCMTGIGQLLDFTTFLSPIATAKICENGTAGAGGGFNAAPALSLTNGVVTGITMNARGQNYWDGGNGPPTIQVVGTQGSGFAGTVNRGFSDDFAIASGGSAYSVNDTLTVTGGSGTAATLEVTSVSGGVITGFSFTSNGAYTSLPASPVSVSGGTGTGATFSYSSTGVSSVTINNGGSGYGYPHNVITKTVETGLYACPFSTTGTCASRAIAMALNSNSNPTWQRVESGNSSNPRTWRWSYRFTSQNGMPRNASLTASEKCDPTKTGPWGSQAAFESDTNCYEDRNDSNTFRPWRTGPGWYFFIVDSTQQFPTGGSNAEQPYTITMDYSTQ